MYSADFSKLQGQPAFVEIPHNKPSGVVLEAIRFNDQSAQATTGNLDIAFGNSAP